MLSSHYLVSLQNDRLDGITFQKAVSDKSNIHSVAILELSNQKLVYLMMAALLKSMEMTCEILTPCFFFSLACSLLIHEINLQIQTAYGKYSGF